MMKKFKSLSPLLCKERSGEVELYLPPTLSVAGSAPAELETQGWLGSSLIRAESLQRRGIGLGWVLLILFCFLPGLLLALTCEEMLALIEKSKKPEEVLEAMSKETGDPLKSEEIIQVRGAFEQKFPGVLEEIQKMVEKAAQENAPQRPKESLDELQLQLQIAQAQDAEQAEPKNNSLNTMIQRMGDRGKEANIFLPELTAILINTFKTLEASKWKDEKSKIRLGVLMKAFIEIGSNHSKEINQKLLVKVLEVVHEINLPGKIRGLAFQAVQSIQGESITGWEIVDGHVQPIYDDAYVIEDLRSLADPQKSEIAMYRLMEDVKNGNVRAILGLRSILDHIETPREVRAIYIKALLALLPKVPADKLRDLPDRDRRIAYLVLSDDFKPTLFYLEGLLWKKSWLLFPSSKPQRLSPGVQSGAVALAAELGGMDIVGRALLLPDPTEMTPRTAFRSLILMILRGEEGFEKLPSEVQTLFIQKCEALKNDPQRKDLVRLEVAQALDVIRGERVSEYMKDSSGRLISVLLPEEIEETFQKFRESQNWKDGAVAEIVSHGPQMLEQAQQEYAQSQNETHRAWLRKIIIGLGDVPHEEKEESKKEHESRPQGKEQTEGELLTKLGEYNQEFFKHGGDPETTSAKLEQTFQDLKHEHEEQIRAAVQAILSPVIEQITAALVEVASLKDEKFGVILKSLEAVLLELSTVSEKESEKKVEVFVTPETLPQQVEEARLRLFRFEEISDLKKRQSARASQDQELVLWNQLKLFLIVFQEVDGSLQMMKMMNEATPLQTAIERMRDEIERVLKEKLGVEKVSIPGQFPYQRNTGRMIINEQGQLVPQYQY